MSSKQKALDIIKKYGGTWAASGGAWLEVTVDAPNGKVFREHNLHGIVLADGDTMEQCWAGALEDLTTSDGNPNPFGPCYEYDCDVCGAD